MKNLAMVVLVGLAIATLGAVGGGWYVGKDRKEPNHEGVSGASPEQLQQRLAAVERQLVAAQLQGPLPVAVTQPNPEAMAQEAPSAKPRQSAPVGVDRDKEVVEQFERDLLHQEDLLTKHAAEPIDRQWAPVAARQLSDQFSEGKHQAQVDCRSQSCVARVAFASREAAVEFLHSPQLPVPRTCNGFTSVPQLADGDSSYELTVVYTPCNQGNP